VDVPYSRLNVVLLAGETVMNANYHGHFHHGA
jgi:hypothetical protein